MAAFLLLGAGYLVLLEDFEKDVRMESRNSLLLVLFSERSSNIWIVVLLRDQRAVRLALERMPSKDQLVGHRAYKNGAP